MRQNLKNSSLVSFFILILATWSHAGTLDEIQRRYMQYNDFIVVFTQDTYQALVDKRIHFTGKVFYKRDVGVRMDVYEPQRQMIILKDQTVLIHLPDENTTTCQELPKEIASQNILGFFSGLNSIDEDYTIEDTQDELILHPKGGTGFISIQTDESDHISRILLKDATGNNSTIVLSDYQFNTGMQEDIFFLNQKPE
ncbi:MAG TPA: outer membrane lipoprotein carrier protein LolA [Deltaproteobacteria bacterium]|nr:outer membrane lipoprotein carrier protein LolA [Deltaproteobacteria bacterium]